MNDIFFLKLSEILSGSNMLASFTDFQCQGADDYFGFVRLLTLEINIQSNLYFKQL